MIISYDFFDWNMSENDKRRAAPVIGVETTHDAEELNYDGSVTHHVWFNHEGRAAHMQSNMLCVDFSSETPEKTIERIKANNESRAARIKERDARDALETEANAILLRIFPGNSISARRARSYVRENLTATDILKADKRRDVLGIYAPSGFWGSKTATHFIAGIRAL